MLKELVLSTFQAQIQKKAKVKVNNLIILIKENDEIAVTMFKIKDKTYKQRNNKKDFAFLTKLTLPKLKKELIEIEKEKGNKEEEKIELVEVSVFLNFVDSEIKIHCIYLDQNNKSVNYIKNIQ
jgi:hypothetical protein